MTVMEPGSEILKVDEVGRVWTPAEKREALLAEFDRSGMTGAQFARFSGVKYSTLMNWLQKRRKKTGQMVSAEQDHPGWLEARVQVGIPNSENIEVEIGCEIRMLVGSHAQGALAGELLRAMGLGRGCWEACGVCGGGGRRHAKGFEGLSALVGTLLNEQVKSGALFAFSNRRRTQGLWAGNTRTTMILPNCRGELTKRKSRTFRFQRPCKERYRIFWALAISPVLKIGAYFGDC